jgi:hypothetical protein
MLFSECSFPRALILKLEQLMDMIFFQLSISAIDACLTFMTCMVCILQHLTTSFQEAHMKKIVLAAFVTLLFSSAAFAASGKANTGCGLGTLAWSGRADGSIVSQASQATTNGSFGSQTFGITSGTSECGTPPKVFANERLKEFVVANMDNLAKDIAVGRGESLNTFDELLQIPADQRPEFNAKLQSSFGSIFTHDQIAYAEVMTNVTTVTTIQ